MSSLRVVSCAQHGEDLRLARAFPGREGMYVDVGAASPWRFSVTKLFYDRGWSGINVEPSLYWWEELQAARPRDVNLAVAISDVSGEITLYDGRGDDALFATVESVVAEELASGPRRVEPRTVPCITLAELFCEHLPGRNVDFLKVDVEGHESQVLAGNDWSLHRPRVLVVEAVLPSTEVPSYQRWEHILLDARYHLAAVDPINRFYVREEDERLAPALAAPVED